jgi:hypothetical protein
MNGDDDRDGGGGQEVGEAYFEQVDMRDRTDEPGAEEEANFEKIDLRVTEVQKTVNVVGADLSHPPVAMPVNTGNIQGPYGHKLMNLAIWGEYIYAVAGLVLGLSCVIGGIVLGLNGVAGSTSWTARVLGMESSINDAAPGVVLFIVGLFIVYVTKPKVTMKDIKG